VIVCTDGRANVGVGSLETEDDYSMCHHFYDQTTNMAASYGYEFLQFILCPANF